MNNIPTHMNVLLFSCIHIWDNVYGCVNKQMYKQQACNTVCVCGWLRVSGQGIVSEVGILIGLCYAMITFLTPKGQSVNIQFIMLSM